MYLFVMSVPYPSDEYLRKTIFNGSVSIIIRRNILFHTTMERHSPTQPCIYDSMTLLFPFNDSAKRKRPLLFTVILLKE